MIYFRQIRHFCRDMRTELKSIKMRKFGKTKDKGEELIMNRNTNNRGITLIALVITIIVLLILAGVSISMLTGENGILTQANKAKKATEEAAKEENSKLSSIENYMVSEAGYNQEKGVDEPRILNGMTPVMFNLPTDTEKGYPIKQGEQGFQENNWYDYSKSEWANAVTEDGSYWVWIPRYAYKITYNNPSDKSQGGKIDVKFLIGTTDEYYTDDTKTTKATAKRATSADEEVDTTTDYYVHPAFTNESSIDYANGGWDKELTGIWVAKFEAGYASGNNSAPVKASSVNYTQMTAWVPAKEAGTTEDSTQTARNWLDGIYVTYSNGNWGWKNGQQTSIKYPTFQPKTYSMNYLNINDAYNISKVLTEKGNIYGLSSVTTDSHLVKNSEWGAIVYLAQSQYGNNGVEQYKNNINLNSGSRKRKDENGKIGVDSVYSITGITTGKAGGIGVVKAIEDINLVTGNSANNGIYIWNQSEGQKASTTLNMYGVFDMNGGNWETSAGYIANETWSLSAYGASLISAATTSSKYVTVYPHNVEKDNRDIPYSDANSDIAGQANYEENKYIYGDAIRETSNNGTGATSWGNTSSAFPGMIWAFIGRGGDRGSSISGLEYFSRTKGDSIFYVGFRTILVAL